MGYRAVIYLSLARQCQSCQITRDSQPLFSAHYANVSYLIALISINRAERLGRKQAFPHLCGEHCVLANVRECVVPDAATIDRRDALSDFVGRELYGFLLGLLALAKHIGFFW